MECTKGRVKGILSGSGKEVYSEDSEWKERERKREGVGLLLCCPSCPIMTSVLCIALW